MAQNVGQVALDIVVGKNDVDGYLGKLGGVAKGVGKAVGAGLAVAGGAIATIGTQAVQSYAQYEQLVGGVETLFKDSADTVIENASRAYTTAGLSANDYMQTVTSFSASLLQSLGGDTVKAGEYADMAITDMADNANKMGTSMEMIQNAYQGFAKQNYTMLDNLKLGYGGTKGEMERLLEDATAISGIEFDISSYADVVEAVHIIQEQMGITGTTALEASGTIQGSLSAMGASWQNLLTGLTDPTQNFDQLITNFVNSVGTALGNLVPRITTTLSGITDMITQLAPVIVAEVPNLVSTVLPSLVEGAVTLVSAVAEMLPNLFQMIVGMLPMLIQMLVTTLVTLIPDLTTGLVDLIVMLCTNFSQIIQPIIDNLPAIIMSILNALMDNLPQLIEGLIALTIAIVGAMPEIIMALIECIPQIIVSVVDALIASLPTLLEGIGRMLASVGEFLLPAVTWFDENIIQPIIAWIQGAWDWCVNLFSTVGSWIYDNVIKPVADFFVGLWDSIVSSFHTVIDPWIEIIKRASAIVYDSVIKPIADFFVGLWENIKGVFSAVGTWFNNTVVQPVIRVFSNAWNGLKNGAVNAWNGIKSVFSTVANFFGDIFGKAWDGVKKVFSTGGKIFDGIKDGIVTAFKAVVNAIIRGINTVVAVPFNAINGVLNRLRSIDILGVRPFGWLGTIGVPQIPQLEQGGVLKKGQVGLLEGKGAEAVVPLEKNTGWLNKIADILNQKMGVGGFASAIKDAVNAPTLNNVKAGMSPTVQDDGKLGRLIELLEKFISEKNDDMTIPIYIGNELVDEYILNKNNRTTLRSGGRA